MCTNQSPEDTITSQFSSIDGSHKTLKSFTKDAIRDPDSFQHIKTVYKRTKPGYIEVHMTFRARNGFGGMTIGTARGIYTEDGYVISQEILN